MNLEGLVTLTVATVFPTVLAQATDFPSWGNTLINSGVMGGVLYWFMVRNDKRMIAQEQAIRTNSDAVLMLVMTLNQDNERIREEAKRLLDANKPSVGS